MRSLALPVVHLETLRDHLLQPDGLERFAYAFCTRSGDDRLLVADVVPVPDDAMKVQRRTACRPDLAFERAQLESCLARGYQPLILHSHAFADEAGFSGIDVAAMEDYVEWLHPLYPEAEIAFGVLGREDLDATVYDPATDRFHDLPFTVPGHWRLDTPLAVDTPTAAVDSAVYDRSIRFLGEDGQRRIAATTVAVVGAGGLGFELVKKLARLGVQKIVVIDFDHVETTNLNRLTGTSPYDVGRPKVTVLAQQLHNTDLDVAVEAVPERVEDAVEALRGCDVIVGAADQVTARSFLNQYAVQQLRSYLDAGVIIRTEDDQVTAVQGSVQLVVPGANACYACLDRADPELARREQLSDEELEEEVADGYIDAAELDPEPAIITLNGTIASMAVSVFARLIAGYHPPPDMLRYEELGSELVELSTRRDPQCPTCGADGLLAQGDREVSDAELADLESADSTLDLAVGDDDAVVTAPRDGDTHRWAGVTQLRTLLRRVMP